MLNPTPKGTPAMENKRSAAYSRGPKPPIDGNEDATQMTGTKIKK